MKKAIVFSLVALLLNQAAFVHRADAQKDFPAEYDAYIRKVMEKIPDIPAFAVVVVKDDKPVFVRGYGIADREAGIKADADTMFYIASSTKSFTGLAAALLDKDGKIDLDDPVNNYSAGLQIENPFPDKVTVRDLLTHTSGLKNDPLAFRMAYSGESDPKDMAKVYASATTFNDQAYGKYDYDNLGYNIYAVLLQNHLKKKWQDVLQERIFDPLGMKHTTAYISRAAAKKWSVAAPYMFDPETGKTARAPLAKTDNNMQSAGGLFASASDLGKWLSMNMNDGKLNGKQVVPADVIRAAHTGYTKITREPAPFTGEAEYGLGWVIGKYKNEKVVYHHGGFPGYRSHISYLPEKKIGVAVLVNDAGAGGRAAHVVATYAYDWWLKSEGLEADYAKQLQDLVDNYEKGKQGAMTAFADRAKRPNQLSLPYDAYAGKYTSDHFGTFHITSDGKRLTVKLGNMKTVATNFTEKETIRVELIPGSGEVISFVKTDDKISALRYGNSIFTKDSAVGKN